MFTAVMLTEDQEVEFAVKGYALYMSGDHFKLSG